MKRITKKLLLPLAALAMAAAPALQSCNNDIGMGTLAFNYVYVRSELAGENYYHIKRWKEYSPEGGTLGKPYVGLEFSTVSNVAYYFYEIGLQYVFTTDYVASFGKAVE